MGLVQDRYAPTGHRHVHKLEAEVVETDPVARRLPLAGTVEQLSWIFGTRLDGVTGRP